MAKQRYYLDTRVFTAFFIAAMPFVAFGSFVVVNVARNQLRESVGANLEQRAVQTKLGLEQYLAGEVVHLRLLALSPDVQQALSGTPRALPAAEEAAKLEQDWAAGRDPKLVASVVEAKASSALRALGTVHPVVRQLQIVDALGRVVAAAGRSGRLFYGESAWFQDVVGQEGDARPFVGDMVRPKGSSLTLLELAYPVRDAGGATLGAIRALLDANDLYTVLAPVRVGTTGHAILVRSTDGLILASDESERILKATLPGFDSLRSAMEGFPIGESGQAIFGRSRLHRGYWSLPEVRVQGEDGRTAVVEPARLVGFSPVDQFGLKWLVAVEQDLSEALAPIQTVTRYLWIHFIGVFATVILLALYFSFKLERPVMEDDLHLHEAHVPAGMKTPAES
jgi:hypothetical protein